MADKSALIKLDAMATELKRQRTKHMASRTQGTKMAAKDAMLPDSASTLGARPMLQRIVESQVFDSLCATMIVCSCLLIGITTEVTKETDTEPTPVRIADYCCGSFFFVELVLRLGSQGRAFFTSDENRWNMFDLVLVLQSVAEIVINAVGGVKMSTIKIIKIMRIFRVFRIFRFLQELSLLVLMIADSVRSLCWALLMLTIVIYVFAVLLTQLCNDFVKANPDAVFIPEAKKQWGGMLDSVYSLVLSMMGGISWGEMSDVLLKIGIAPALLFFFYLTFTLLAVLNIITGVFVENAMEVAKTQRSVLVKKEEKLRVGILKELRKLFIEMDSDCSGTITLNEMKMLWSDHHVATYFSAMGLELSDATTLFFLIDVEGNDEIEVDQFLEGCSRLTGEARNIDMALVLNETKNAHKQTKHIARKLEQVQSQIPTLVAMVQQVALATKAAQATTRQSKPDHVNGAAAPMQSCDEVRRPFFCGSAGDESSLPTVPYVMAPVPELLRESLSRTR